MNFVQDVQVWKQFSRIIIFGRSGSGKSTSALHLHKMTGFPLHHIDRYFYLEKWQERPEDEFLAVVHEVIAQEQWIFDGNGMQSLELRYARADLCLYFNYPRYRCYWRAFKRYLKRNEELQDRGPQCPEVFFMWRFISYIWNFDSYVKEGITRLRAQYPEVVFFEITSDTQLRDVEARLRKHHNEG